MNEVIEQLLNHRTYRKLDPTYRLPQEALQQILDSARQAPTWMNAQLYSIIVLEKKTTREKIFEWVPTNHQIVDGSVFLIFVADLERAAKVVKAAGDLQQFNVGKAPDPLIWATIDASLAAENALVAAESLELGGVVTGSITSHAEELSALLGLPEYTYPLFGLALGKPAAKALKKPRLPEKAVIHYEKWTDYPAALLQEYDQTLLTNKDPRDTVPWTEKIDHIYTKAVDPEITDTLRKQKLLP